MAKFLKSINTIINKSDLLGGLLKNYQVVYSVDHVISKNKQYSTKNSDDSDDKVVSEYRETKFVTPSPFKPKDTPTRMGFKQKFFDGGLLPRLDEPIWTLPKYKPSGTWSEKKALFGQNDYIDILGNGNISPHELIKGPVWIQGFRGHEFARTLRRLKYTGVKLRATHPKLHADLSKHMRYLYKEHNQARKSHRPKSKKM